MNRQNLDLLRATSYRGANITDAIVVVRCVGRARGDRLEGLIQPFKWEINEIGIGTDFLGFYYLNNHSILLLHLDLKVFTGRTDLPHTHLCGLVLIMDI